MVEKIKAFSHMINQTHLRATSLFNQKKPAEADAQEEEKKGDGADAPMADEEEKKDPADGS